ncbi:MAG TPA: CHAT domain-containing protein [Thermoanaerobaculia bacterium]|jgi:CHAT domain-containing protein|nr:CHAT domain-containing protein [Thermoanaerobaculia bacterium]
MKIGRWNAALVLILLLVTARDAGAQDRLEKIMVLWPSGDFDVLRVQIHEALTAYREARDPRREAIAYLFLTLVDISVGDAQNARTHFGEATTRFEASGDSVGAWLAYWMFAEHERLQERQSEHVLAFYEKAFAMLEKAKSPSAPFSIDALMVVGPIVGLPPEDYESNNVLKLLEVFTRIGYSAEFVRVDELEKADVELRRAKEAAAIFNGRLDPPIDRHIGALRRRQGLLDDARESYQKALDGLTVLRPIGVITPKRMKVDIFAELAEIEMLSGRIDDALAWNDRALQLVREEKSEETEVVVLKSRADLLVRTGRFPAAETAFARALELADKNEYFYLQVSLYLNSAQMNRTRGRYGAAAADMEKSIEALGKSNEPEREPAIWGNLAMMYVLLDASDSARVALEKARQLAESHGRCLDVATIDLIEASRKFVKGESSSEDFSDAMEQWIRTPDARSVSGAEDIADFAATMTDPQLSYGSGMLVPGTVELLQAGTLIGQGRQFAEARELALKALEVLPNLNHRATAIALIGMTYVGEGGDEKAIDWLKKSLDAFDEATEASRADPLLRGSGDGDESAIIDLLVPLLVKHGHHEEAFALSERARARVFLQLMGNHRVTPRGAGNTLPAQEAETLRTQMLQWEQQLRIAPTKQLDDDIREARLHYEALMTRVRATNPEYASMTGIEPLTLEAIREELPANTTLISYFTTQNRVHAWVLDRTSLQYVALPAGPKAVERAQCTAQRFNAGGRGVRPLHEPCEPVPAEELYGRLFAPLRAHIRNPRLIIVPHGALHYLSFGAFRNMHTERYLIEDYTITYAPSASAIRFLREKETPVKGKALVIGAPAGVSPELPGAMREARMVAAELHSMPMIGTAAKESLLYQLKGDVDLVHIAAHGFYEGDTPLFSRLALAAGDGRDGNLEVHEILSDVDLTGVNLVVLSACQTAVGKGAAGDEIVGLTRALLYAGTPGVISTLWDIGDEATSVLMTHFYSRLLDGASAADALRHAQLQMLHGSYPDPQQWAAFTLNGDPQGRW